MGVALRLTAASSSSSSSSSSSRFLALFLFNLKCPQVLGNMNIVNQRDTFFPPVFIFIVKDTAER